MPPAMAMNDACYLDKQCNFTCVSAFETLLLEMLLRHWSGYASSDLIYTCKYTYFILSI